MSNRRWLIAAILVFITILAVVPAATMQETLQAELAQSGVFTDVYNRVSPSVVAINVTAHRDDVQGFGQNGEVHGSGSGFVIDSEGHIVTNNHVVEGATRIEVNFFDGTLAHAEVVGLDPDSDLAVLDVDLPAEMLYPIAWGNSDELVIGEPVLAIGSPFGQRWTLTSGIVSAVDRTIQGLTNFSIGGVIQTDTSINPGNSGGPLLDLQGNVIGVNSQIMSESGSNSGIGFAIPINLTQKVSQSLISDGSVSYSYLGIGGGDVTLSLIDTLELSNNTRGVVVADVSPDGPAARAGLQAPASFEDVDGEQVPTSVDIIPPLTASRSTASTGLFRTLPRTPHRATALRSVCCAMAANSLI